MIADSKRKLRSGSEFDVLIPKPTGKMVLRYERGTTDDTITLMKEVTLTTLPVSYTHLDVYKRQLFTNLFDLFRKRNAKPFAVLIVHLNGIQLVQFVGGETLVRFVAFIKMVGHFIRFLPEGQGGTLLLKLHGLAGDGTIHVSLGLFLSLIHI